jgi:transposase
MQEDRMSHLPEEREVILGVDTHLDVHVAVLIDVVGRIVATTSVPTTALGYEQLIEWARGFGRFTRAGIEGTGTYGAALARRMHEHGVKVLEINRPDRSRRRLRGKSDPTDAENAARAVLAGEANAIPKAQSGIVEAMRAVSMARRSAVKAKTQAINQLRALLVTAPESIRAKLWKGRPEQCVARCAQLQSLGDTPLLQALTNTLRLLASRWMNLAKELHQHDAAIVDLTKRAGRRLLGRFGVGPQTAATLLVTAGDNPNRLRSEAALAALCGASPLEASSGKTTRHRLNRGGDRTANNALWTISMVRMRSDPRTRAYVARRTAEGLSTKEIQRCLKRYIVRELYPLILADLADSVRKT